MLHEEEVPSDRYDKREFDQIVVGLKLKLYYSQLNISGYQSVMILVV